MSLVLALDKQELLWRFYPNVANIRVHRVEPTKGKHKAQSLAILALLQEHYFIPSHKLSKISLQYNARIYYLKRGKIDGKKHIILSRRDGNVYGYEYGGIQC